VLSAELDCDQYHVGSDSARVALQPAVPGGAAAWVACVDLGPADVEASDRAAPRAQLTLLVALSGADDAARWFRRWAPAAGDEAPAATARAELAASLGDAGLSDAIVDRVRSALLAT